MNSIDKILNIIKESPSFSKEVEEYVTKSENYKNLSSQEKLKLYNIWLDLKYNLVCIIRGY